MFSAVCVRYECLALDHQILQYHNESLSVLLFVQTVRRLGLAKAAIYGTFQTATRYTEGARFDGKVISPAT